MEFFFDCRIELDPVKVLDSGRLLPDLGKVILEPRFFPVETRKVLACNRNRVSF